MHGYCNIEQSFVARYSNLSPSSDCYLHHAYKRVKVTTRDKEKPSAAELRSFPIRNSAAEGFL
jgi:hypothetical protein